MKGWALPGLLALPLFAGLLGILLPAFDHLPALGHSGVSLQPFWMLMDQPGLVRSCLISLFVGLLAPALTVGIVALSLAGLSDGLARGERTRVAGLVHALLAPLLALPHAATAIAFAFLVAPSGLIVRIISPELTGWTTPPDVLIPGDAAGLSLAAGLVLKEVPFLLFATIAALSQTRPGPSARLAASLGRKPVEGFLLGIWPQLYRRVRLPVLAIVVYSTTAVDMALVLGPDLPASLAVRVSRWMNEPDLSSRFLASAGTLLQVLVTLVALAMWRIGEAWSGIVLKSALAGGRWRPPETLLWAGLALLSFVFACLLAGLIALALWAFAGPWRFPDALPGSFDLGTVSRVMEEQRGPLLATLGIAVATTVTGLVLVVLHLLAEGEQGVSAAVTRQDGWLLLPLLLPDVAFLFGLQIWLLLLQVPPSATSVAMVHLLFVVPYIHLFLAGPWRALDRRHESVAVSLGMRPFAALVRVRLPLLLGPILASAATGFAVSVALYLPTLVIGGGRVATLTTEAVALTSGGDRRVLGALALLQMLLPLGVFLMALAVPPLVQRDRRGWAGLA